jgi:hypothetical protein
MTSRIARLSMGPPVLSARSTPADLPGISVPRGVGQSNDLLVASAAGSYRARSYSWRRRCSARASRAAIAAGVMTSGTGRGRMAPTLAGRVARPDRNEAGVVPMQRPRGALSLRSSAPRAISAAPRATDLAGDPAVVRWPTNATKTLQTIMFDAASGNRDAYGPALRVLEVTHKVMQPTREESKGGGPIVPRLIRPNPAAPPAPPHPAPDAVPPNAVVDADGTVYVEAE